ncbi:hypothetical protein MD484_g8967, partial [Candolleomyces efflorescens]
MRCITVSGESQPVLPLGVELARATPAASPSVIVKIAQESSKSTQRKKGKTPKYTTHGPSRRMVLIQFKLGEDVPALNADRLRTGVNKALVQSQSTLRIESRDFAYGGYSLHMNGVATQQELDVLRGVIIAICVEAGYKGQPWVGLPQSMSYLKIRNAPYFRDSDLSVCTTPVDIINAFRASPLGDWFKPAAPARIDRESKASTSATVYLNIWDSTSGSNANALINNR